MLHPVWPLLASDKRQGPWPPSTQGLWDPGGSGQRPCKGWQSSGERGRTHAGPCLLGVLDSGRASLSCWCLTKHFWLNQASMASVALTFSVSFSLHL